MSATPIRILLPPPCAPGAAERRFSQKTRDTVFSFLLLLLALALIWICRLYGPSPVRQMFGREPFESPFDLLLLLGTVLAAMLLHESGHLLASLGLGFAVLGGSIGPLQIQVLPGDWRVSWSVKSFLTASISAVPRTMNQWRGAMMTVIAAGPLATLSTGLFGASFHPNSPFWMVTQSYFVQVSLLLFVLGLIPNGEQARRPNDARLLMDLLRHNQGAEELELKVLLQQHLLDGRRPQDYQQDLLMRVAAFRGRAEARVLFAQTLSQWATESEEMDLADCWDMQAVAAAEFCRGTVQNSALASSACFDVTFRDDMESARGKFAQVDFDALFPEYLAHRARAAQQIAWGRLHRAPAHILKAQYALPRGIAYYSLERNLLERLHMKALAGGQAHRLKSQSATA